VKANEDVATSKNERSSTVVLLVGIGEEKQLSRMQRPNELVVKNDVTTYCAANVCDE